MIELYLSSDGKHTVHVSTETLEEIVELAPQAKALYDRIVERYGNKAQMWQATNGKGSGNVLPPAPQMLETPQQAEQAAAPRCPVHDKPMKLRQGRYGTFWSCSVRSPAGEWCPITKEVGSEGDEKASGQKA